MNVSCPQCSTTYRVDPAKVPQAGVNARCGNCSGVFRVAVEGDREGSTATAAAVSAPPAPTSTPEPTAAPRGTTAGAPAVARAPEAAPSQQQGAQSPQAAATPPARSTSPFGSADPQARARRLARALVSDIVVYHPERREKSRRDGTLRQEFREEIRKSWEEDVAQVGTAFARETPFFRDALNEILAGGDRVF
jgi:predicted Zn finger-like uncharacterized protein